MSYCMRGLIFMLALLGPLTELSEECPKSGQ
jgi:hypothetical protein